MKRVLLTGVSGFVASHIFEHIMKNTDWFVIGMHRSSQAGNLERIQEIVEGHPEWSKRYSIIHHDFRDSVSEHTAALIGHIDMVLHVGASSHIDRSITNPKEFALDNTIGTINLLDWVKKQPGFNRDTKNANAKGLDRNIFLYFSTDEVFGNAPEGTAYDENSPHKPRNPYAASKAAAEDFCYSYHITYGVPLIITNTMNIIGERQHPEKYLPLVMNKIIDGEKLLIHSSPDRKTPGKRFYLHARSAVAALMHVLEHGELGERYNIIGEKELDNLQMAQLIEKSINEKMAQATPPKHYTLKYELVDFHSSRPGHDLRYALNGAKLKKLGYEHRYAIEENIRQTVFWTIEKQDKWLKTK